MHMMFHTVKPGDTLWKIAHHHHTSIHHLLHINPAIKDPNLIYIGQKLKFISFKQKSPPSRIILLLRGHFRDNKKKFLQCLL